VVAAQCCAGSRADHRTDKRTTHTCINRCLIGSRSPNLILRVVSALGVVATEFVEILAATR
jgi:hypothetical protein